LWPYRHRRIGALSGGQQQRVLIARALVRRPQLLVLDEPTEGVDPALQEGFYVLLRRLHRDQGITIFLVTHDVGVILKEATRVACVNQRLVFHGPPDDLSDVHLSQLYGVPIGLLEHRHEWGIP
jgi:zinc transport system ATP-binding protein